MHVASHAAHACEALANLPSGVQSSTHADVGESAKGWLAAHAVQSVLALPPHVAQLAWHGTHASAAVELPPAQV